jgi:2-polyprenyl-3-methyl-5-hydroxy-6-metoxy-1,4-benzoquinol methylase
MNSDKVTKLFYSIIPMRFVRFHAYRVNKFIQKLSLEYDFDGNTVLDIGAGSASNSAYFSKAKYVSQDIIQNRYKTIDYVFDICKDAGAINDESVDVILCSQVLEHLTDPKNALIEM